MSFARANESTNHLVDRGANGGLGGADLRILQKTDMINKIVGIDDHELTGLDVVTAAALFDTWKGPVIGIFHEYGHFGKGRSIHVAGQMEWFNCKVDDRILDFYTFIPFLQYAQSVFPRCFCMGNRGCGSEGLKQAKMPLFR